MRKRRVIVLIHTDLVPPENIKPKDINRNQDPWITEYDVINSLKKNGHDVLVIGVYSDLLVIRNAIEEFKPHVIYNLLEEFDGETLFDTHVVAYLELLKAAYTGSNPRGLMLSRDKALSKKIMTYHRIATPKFWVFLKNKKIKITKQIKYPLIVKCLAEEASLGIAKASVVHNEEKLIERVSFIQTSIGVDAIAEEFVEGREFYVGVLGNSKTETLPVWELIYQNVESPEKELYSRSAKWNEKYRKRKGTHSKKAELSANEEILISNIAKKTYKSLGLNGYARIDLRMNKEGKVYVIEANPNPNIARDDEFALSALHKNISYQELQNKILKLAENWGPRSPIR